MTANCSTSEPGDRTYLLVLTSYLSLLLVFSSFFYLGTEDYETIVAVNLIEQGIPIGKSTGWPYLPLTPYLYYLYSLAFGGSLLGFRILTVLFMLASVLPIFWTLRYLCPPFLSFALTIFSFSLTTLPQPRLEYYIEAAFLAYAIYFAVRSIDSTSQRDVYLSGIFLTVAFASRGFPNSALLLVLLPAALVLAHRFVESRPGCFEQQNPWLSTPGRKKLTGLLLSACCCVLLIALFKKTAFHAAIFEYARMRGPAEFQNVKDLQDSLTLILITIAIAIYGLVTWRQKFRPLRVDIPASEQTESHGDLATRQLLLPFFLCGLAALLLLFLIGQPLEHIVFFLFPLDMFLDHAKQLTSGRTYVIPFFVCLSGTLFYLYFNGVVVSKRAKIALFLTFLLPATFTRFFPSYNMLYFISFALGIFVSAILPAAIKGLFRDNTSITARLQLTLGIFFTVFAVSSNIFLLMKTQVEDLQHHRVATIAQEPVAGIFIEKDVLAYFATVDQSLKSLGAEMQDVAFFSNRYLNYVPLIYGYKDVMAGQNLITGLGKTWSYDDILKVEGVSSESALDWPGMVYSWREVAVQKLAESGADIIVMSLYDSSKAHQSMQPSADPFREYLRSNFRIANIIEPKMKIHRRSIAAEGAVILIRKTSLRD